MATDREQREGFGATVAATQPRVAPGQAGEIGAPTLSARTTVLPPSQARAEGGAAARYEAVRTLGAGGMGEVALVRDHDIGRTVAVKRPISALDGHALQRFAREVRTVGRLEHPGIVPIHDVGLDEEGRHYFVMKYVEGDTLAKIIERLRTGDQAYVARYTYEARTQIFTQLLHAVHYAHARGVLHRDIKPDNIMVGPYGEVMLMDWGIARDLTDKEELATATPAISTGAIVAAPAQTADGVLLGTPAYMSPEQARGEIAKLDERSDVYSLCVVFFELIFLRHYLPDKRGIADLLTSIGHDPEFTTQEWYDLHHRYLPPAELVHFLRKGMAKDPAARYQSVAEMIKTLDTVRDHRVAVQCQITFMKRILGGIEHAIDRHPRKATVVLVLVGLTAAWALAMGAWVVVQHLK